MQSWYKKLCEVGELPVGLSHLVVPAPAQPRPESLNDWTPTLWLNLRFFFMSPLVFGTFSPRSGTGRREQLAAQLAAQGFRPFRSSSNSTPRAGRLSAPSRHLARPAQPINRSQSINHSSFGFRGGEKKAAIRAQLKYVWPLWLRNRGTIIRLL